MVVNVRKWVLKFFTFLHSSFPLLIFRFGFSNYNHYIVIPASEIFKHYCRRKMKEMQRI